MSYLDFLNGSTGAKRFTLVEGGCNHPRISSATDNEAGTRAGVGRKSWDIADHVSPDERDLVDVAESR